MNSNQEIQKMESRDYSKGEWLIIALVYADCLMRLAALLFVFISPENAPNVAGFRREMKYPEFQIAVLAFSVPGLVFLSVPALRSAKAIKIIGCVFFVESLVFIVLGFFLSASITGSAIAYALTASMLFRKGRLEPDKRNAEQT